jgi:hypothetical protein
MPIRRRGLSCGLRTNVLGALTVFSPSDDPLRHSQIVSKRFHYDWLFSETALQRAIDEIVPDLLIPFDDRTVMHLHALHRTTTNSATCELIGRSLGKPIFFPLIESRFELLHLAAKSGLPVPPSMRLTSETDLDGWDQPFPWVLKSSMSWGGDGVRVVGGKHEAREAFHLMNRPTARVRAVWRWLNESEDMETAVKTIAHELSLSGLNGLDFMIDVNGVAWLIELNPRATQTGHLYTSSHFSLADRLANALRGRVVSTECPVDAGTVITLFPGLGKQTRTIPGFVHPSMTCRGKSPTCCAPSLRNGRRAQMLCCSWRGD